MKRDLGRRMSMICRSFNFDPDHERYFLNINACYNSFHQKNACRKLIRLALIILLIPLFGFPTSASAHVKWFCSTVDVRTPLLPLADVLSQTFLSTTLIFTTLVFLGFLLDGWVARRWPALSSSGMALAAAEETLLRLSTAAYFLLLWDNAASVLWRVGDAILTPELTTQASWIGKVQLTVAVFVISRRTCILAAIGIGALYLDAVRQYGVFHMTDYVFFPGTAAYLALSSIGSPRAIKLRLPILSGSLAFGLMWTAIEKFLYPQWTLSVVFNHPALAFGFDPRFVVVVAGFIEFSLAFFIMFGRGLMRIGAAGFMAVFLGAIPEFGHLDAVGHILILGILGVVLLHGASPLQRTIGIIDHDPVVNAGTITAIYAMTISVFFAMYYSLHLLEPLP